MNRVAFYECVSTTVRLDGLTPHDEWSVGDSWVKRAGLMKLSNTLPRREACERVVRQIEALPEDRYLFIAYATPSLTPHMGEGIRLGFFRSPSEELLGMGDGKQPPDWFFPPAEGRSRYAALMEDP
jgi:hypothetical protein